MVQGTSVYRPIHTLSCLVVGPTTFFSCQYRESTPSTCMDGICLNYLPMLSPIRVKFSIPHSDQFWMDHSWIDSDCWWVQNTIQEWSRIWSWSNIIYSDTIEHLYHLTWLMGSKSFIILPTYHVWVIFRCQTVTIWCQICQKSSIECLQWSMSVFCRNQHRVAKKMMNNYWIIVGWYLSFVIKTKPLM